MQNFLLDRKDKLIYIKEQKLRELGDNNEVVFIAMNIYYAIIRVYSIVSYFLLSSLINKPNINMVSYDTNNVLNYAKASNNLRSHFYVVNLELFLKLFFHL